MTYGEYQYAVVYQPVNSVDRFTSIARRKTGQMWDFLVFSDYVQLKDDGHNVISMGISGDGVIHLAWDMHGDGIHYRQSVPGAATNKEWNLDLFSGVLTELPGDEFNFHEITYPRFQTLESGDLLLEFREGRSGLGDCCICKYSVTTAQWEAVAVPYIKGVNNNAYLHGLDYKAGVLHVTWTYRDYVPDRFDDGKVQGSKETAQAGPNGPENNHDLHYIYSDDDGITWYNGQNVRLPSPVDVSHDTLAVLIPKYSGIMNQEGQCVDKNNGVHVLGREFGKYHHYYRNPDTKLWSKSTINDLPAKLFGSRGKIVARDVLYALLPLEGEKFTILTSPLGEDSWTVLETFEDTNGEPLYDRYSQSVSLMQSQGGRVVVIDEKVKM